jgi:hypothetical protein
MNVLHKAISIAVLLTIGMSSLTHARPGRDERDAARAERREQFRRPDAPQDVRPAPPPDQADGNRRQGRMSPEERRALRRQINEAGHDIYAPRR